MDLRLFWRALDAVYAQEAVEAEWLRALEGDKETWRWALDTGLIRATGELSQAYPKLGEVPESPMDYEVICHDDDEDDYVGVCPDGTGKIKLTRPELLLYELDVQKLLEILASLLRLTADPELIAALRHVWRIGGFDPFQAAEAWVFLSLPMESGDLGDAAMQMVATHDLPFLILTPTQRWWKTWPESLRRRGRVVALSDLTTEPVEGDAKAGAFRIRLTMPLIMGPLLASNIPGASTTFRKDGTGWVVAFEGRTVAMDDSLGLSYIAQLLRHPEQPLRASRLLALVSGHETVAERAKDRGQAAMDAQAWRETKEEADDLSRNLARATAANDPAQQAQIRQEMERLGEAKRKAQAKGGRDRKIGSTAENDRKSVGNAIDRAMTELHTHHRALWQHLDATIERGEVLRYRPTVLIPWEL